MASRMNGPTRIEVPPSCLCVLAIAADQLDQYILMRTMEAEDQNS